MAIQIADGFQLRVAKPLDDRQNVETVAQLDPTYGYEGQIVYVKDVKQFYTCYKDENGSLAYKVMENGGGGSSEEQIKDWVSGSSYLEGDYVYHEGEIYRCLTSNSDVDFDEANWIQVTYGIDELSKEDVERLLGLTEEEIEAMSGLLLDTEVRIDKTYSSSKIEERIDEKLADFTGGGTSIYTSLEALGLTADATVEDVVNTLKNGESFLAPVNTFTNYETIFPNRVPNDQWNKIHIIKGTSLASSHIRCFSPSGTFEYLANINNANVVSWNDVSGTYIDISDNVIEKLGNEILKYPVGKYRINSTTTGNKITDLPSDIEMKCGLIEINGTAVDKSPFTDTWVYRMYKFECLIGTLSYVRRLNSGATVGQIELDTGWCKEGKEIYTSLSELGLTPPVSVGEIFNAMPDKTMAVIACEGREGNTEGAEVHVSDVPISYGVLTIRKNEKGRFSIEYQNSLGGSPCDVKRWIGTLKGTDGSGLYWKQLSAEPTFVALNDIGLTSNATFQDVVDALPKGGSALLGVKDFKNYQTIFPYEEGNDQFARVYIVKGWEDGSCMYARWFRKDGSKEAIAIFNINNNKFDGWKRTGADNSEVITSDTIAKYGTEILKYPVGTWRINSVSIANQFTDLPLKDMGSVIEISSIDPNRSPYENTYGYRHYIFKASLDGIIYIRTLNSGDIAGTFSRDTGWQKIATQKDLDELFQSVSSGKTLVANAITGKGVSTSTTATFATMATNISKISGYKEETKTLIVTSGTTGTEALVFTFSANVIAVKQIVAPSDSSYVVPQTSKDVFTINGKELIVYVRGSGTWKVTALIKQ